MDVLKLGAREVDRRHGAARGVARYSRSGTELDRGEARWESV